MHVPKGHPLGISQRLWENNYPILTRRYLQHNFCGSTAGRTAGRTIHMPHGKLPAPRTALAGRQPHIKAMTMTTTTIIDSIKDAWRCHALEPRGDAHGRRCEAGGVRYRDGGQWGCLRHFDAAANEYCGGDRGGRWPRSISMKC
jgi:hypothetical protein